MTLKGGESLEPLVVMMPSPGMGHLIPMIEFAKRLSHHHNLLVTLLIPTNAPPSKAQTLLLTSLPPVISHMFLPSVTLSDLPTNSKAEALIALTVLRSLPSLRHSLLSLAASHRVSALIVDLFGTDAFDVAAELNVPPYFFSTSSAMSLSFLSLLPRLDQEVQCEFRDLPEPIQIPGSILIHGKDLADPIQDRNDDAYKCFLHHAKRCSLAKGIIKNSFPELEPEVLKLLQKYEPGKPPVYTVGPLVKEDWTQTGEECFCMKWLDDQPRGSVIFVCFGSGGTLSSAQVNELALGLEISRQRFCGQNKREGPGGLTWAPQAQVLAHTSTGGFLTHCGWNSVLESVVNGVPLVAWPLYAEQKMNSVLVTEDVKVALRPKVNENGVVEREEIASVVKKLMEGEEGKKLLHRMKMLKEAAATALSENGSSTKQISQLALTWKGETTV